MQNMNVELVAQMFKNYQSNVMFHLEGTYSLAWYLHLLLNDLKQPRASKSPLDNAQCLVISHEQKSHFCQ